MKAIRLFILLFLSLFQISQAMAVELEEVGISYGRGTDAYQWLQLDFIQHVTPPFHFLDKWIHEPYLDIGLAASHWTQTQETAYHLSTSLMIRSQDRATSVGNIFVETGFGPHIISRPGGTGRLGTAFEFNSFLGLGLHLNQDWALITRVRHLSNAGITESNAGVNMAVLQLDYKFNGR